MVAATAWLKAIHIATMLLWCAGLFYLPGLFAAHHRELARQDFNRLRAMTRFAYIAVASPAAVVAVATGTALIHVAPAHGGWLALKLTAVALMVGFHVWCGHILARLRERPAIGSGPLLLSLVAVPAVLVPTVLWLVLGKPV